MEADKLNKLEHIHIHAIMRPSSTTISASLLPHPCYQGAQDDCGDKPGSGKKAWRLRAGMKTLAHLDRQDNNNLSHNCLFD